jgi:hypothetical protein
MVQRSRFAPTARKIRRSQSAWAERPHATRAREAGLPRSSAHQHVGNGLRRLAPQGSVCRQLAGEGPRGSEDNFNRHGDIQLDGPRREPRCGSSKRHRRTSCYFGVAGEEHPLSYPHTRSIQTDSSVSSFRTNLLCGGVFVVSTPGRASMRWPTRSRPRYANTPE